MNITPGLKPVHLITITTALALPGLSTSAATELDAINVTATRTAQTVDETLAAVTVITRDQIEDLQDLDLVELLDGLPGLTLSRNGGLGKSSSIRLRGTGSDHTLVMIDGVRIGSATLGTTALEHLPLQNIERIEVVRGPLSHLYGADAVGGVIQIFTRKGGEATRIDAEAGYGSHDTRRSLLGLSGAYGDTRYSLQASHLESDGFSALKGNNPDRDGYRNQSFSGWIGHRFGHGLELEANFLQASGNNEYDSAWGADSDYSTDFVQQSVSGKLAYAPMEGWALSLTLGETRDESRNLTNGVERSFFNTKRWHAIWQNDFFMGDDAILTLGMDVLRDRVDVSNRYSEDQRQSSGYFIQYQRRHGAHNVVLALRHDDSDAFEDRTTGNIAWGYDVSRGLQLHASYGTAFKAPTFNDLYYLDSRGSSGDPDLAPEKSRSIELGLKGRPEWGRWSLNLFRTRIVDLISWVETPPGSWIYRPQNIDRARIKGLEAGAGAVWAGWEIHGSLTLLDPRDSATGKVLVRRHKRTLRIDIDRNLGKTRVGATLQARSYSYNDLQNTQRVSGFGTVELRASHPLTPNWQIRAEISNLFDKDYEVIRGYNTEGRALFVTLSYRSN